MVEGYSGIGLTAQDSSLAGAYQNLLQRLERALSDDGVEVTEAFKEYTDVYGEVLSDPSTQQRISSVSQRLGDALTRALERPEVRSVVQDATAQYLVEVGEAWSQLSAEDPDVESLVAVASGMTTLAWLHGLRTGGLPGPFDAAQPFAPAGMEASWMTSSYHGNGSEPTMDADLGGPSSWDAGPDAEATAGAESPASTDASDDDGIVWQELSIGGDGQIVQRETARPQSGPGQGEPRRAGASRKPSASRGGTVGAQTSAPTTDPAYPGTAGAARAPQPDPAQLIERAYATYAEGLRAAGVPVSPSEGIASSPAASASTGAVLSDLEQHRLELTSAYLRLAQGIGSVPDLYASYARLLGTASELMEQQLALARSYERLLANARAQRPADLRQAADHHYRRFLAAVRQVWSQVDPSTLPPERLSAMTAGTARGATLHRAAMAAAGHPFLR